MNWKQKEKKMKMIRLMILIYLLATLFFDCTKSPSNPEYRKEITVFGYLWGNEVLDAEHAIFVGYTKPITDYYEFDEAVIQGAQVTVTEEQSGQVTLLVESPDKPGFYHHDSLMIDPKKTYHLKVVVEGIEVTASTTVPPDFGITTELKRDTMNRVQYKNLAREKPLFLECEDPEQIVLVDMYCNETFENAEYVSPFMEHTHPGDQDEYDGGTYGEPRHIQGMARIREFLSEWYPGEYVVDWYSTMIVFYGSNRMQVMAIDNNYHRFLYMEHPELNLSLIHI